MKSRVLKYVLDIESVIDELEQIRTKTKGDFFNFQDNFVYVRAVERDLEIMGEAIKKLIEIEPQIKLSSVRNIIGLRNRISHAYDSIENEMLWGIINKDVPKLKQELLKFKST